MLPLFFSMILAANLGPMGPDPAREPQLAAKGSFVAMTFGAGHKIFFSSSQDSGKSFSPPVQLAEVANIVLTRHRGPHLVFSGDAIVISAIVSREPSAQPFMHGDLMTWRSTDSGKTWSQPVVVNDVKDSANEALHSLAAGKNGELFTAWLDHRGGKGTKLYGSRSTDGGVTWSKNVLVYQSPDGSICECCHPSVAIGPDGEILVMWRNWLGGSRDMYIARSRDGVTFSQVQKLGNGTWPLNACPMDGGGVAVSAGRTVTAWRRAENIFVDEPGQPEKQLGSGKDVALAAGGDRVYVAWSTPKGITLWNGTTAEALAENGAFPALVALPDGAVVAAWEANGAISVARVER